MDYESVKEGKRDFRFLRIAIGCLFLISIPVAFLVLFIASEWPPPVENRVSTFGPLKLDIDISDLQRVDALIEKHSPEDGIYREDFDRDGIEDTIDRSGKVSFARRISSFHGLSAVHSIGFDDVDRDGLTDAWCYDPGDWVMRILWAKKNGKFKTSQQIQNISLGGKGAFFDVDDDGDLDIVLKSEYQTKYHPTARSSSGATVEYSWIKLQKRDPSRWKDEIP